MLRPLVILLTAGLLSSGCKKKPAEVPAIVGWQRADTDRWSCYHPPQWETLPPGDRKLARSKALDAIYAQWTGTRNDGVTFDEEMLTNLETILLGRPEAIEQVSVRNVKECIDARTSGSTIGWGQWLAGLGGQLTEGECPWAPFDYTLYDYLDIGREWQIRGQLCAGDEISVKGTEQDYYQIRKDGPWINVTGDPNDKVADGSPCTRADCLAGQLILRFVGQSGMTTILPVGLQTTFKATEHGELHVMINDTTFDDNLFKTEMGLQHHTGIEYKSANK